MKRAKHSNKHAISKQSNDVVVVDVVNTSLAGRILLLVGVVVFVVDVVVVVVVGTVTQLLCLQLEHIITCVINVK